MILLDWLSRGGVKVEIKNEPRQEVLNPTLQKQVKETVERNRQSLGGYTKKSWSEIAEENKAIGVCINASHPLTLSGYCLIEDCPYMIVQLAYHPEYFMNPLSRDELADYTIKLLAWQKPILEKKNRKATGPQKAAILRKLSKDNDAIAFLYERGLESAELNNKITEELCEAGHWEIAEVFNDSLSLSEDEMIDLIRSGNAKTDRQIKMKEVAQALVDAKNKKEELQKLQKKQKTKMVHQKRSFEQSLDYYNKEVKEWKERTKTLEKQKDDLSWFRAEYL